MKGALEFVFLARSPGDFFFFFFLGPNEEIGITAKEQNKNG